MTYARQTHRIRLSCRHSMAVVPSCLGSRVEALFRRETVAVFRRLHIPAFIVQSKSSVCFDPKTVSKFTSVIITCEWYSPKPCRALGRLKFCCLPLQGRFPRRLKLQCSFSCSVSCSL